MKTISFKRLSPARAYITLVVLVLPTDTHTNRCIDRYIHRNIDRNTDRQIEIQTDRRTITQTDRHTNWKIHKQYSPSIIHVD